MSRAVPRGVAGFEVDPRCLLAAVDRAGHSSVAVVLDRYGHLLPGIEERVTAALDEFARQADQDTARGASVVSLG